MALYAKDNVARGQSADALASLIIGEKNKQRSEASAQQHDMAKLGETDRIGRGRMVYDAEQAEALRKTLPAGSQVRLGEASINTPDPLTNFFRQQGMNDKMRDDSRMETTAMQGEFKKLGGVDVDQLRSFDDIDALLKDVNVNNIGALRAKLARFTGEKGVLTDSDISRYLPNTLMSDLKGIGGYLGLGTGEMGQSITPEIRKQIEDDVKAKKAALIKQQQSATAELKNRAPMLAPTLHQRGQTQQVLDSFGGTVRDAAQEQTKVVGGVTYRKVQGGWEAVE